MWIDRQPLLEQYDRLDRWGGLLLLRLQFRRSLVLVRVLPASRPGHLCDDDLYEYDDLLFHAYVRFELVRDHHMHHNELHEQCVWDHDLQDAELLDQYDNLFNDAELLVDFVSDQPARIVVELPVNRL